MLCNVPAGTLLCQIDWGDPQDSLDERRITIKNTLVTSHDMVLRITGGHGEQHLHYDVSHRGMMYKVLKSDVTIVEQEKR